MAICWVSTQTDLAIREMPVKIFNLADYLYENADAGRMAPVLYSNHKVGESVSDFQDCDETFPATGHAPTCDWVLVLYSPVT
jgi:hypothetical protein